jgi:hypothetical protein
MLLTGKANVLGDKPVPMPLLSLTYPTWTSLESNPCLRRERLATKYLSHCSAENILR